MALIIAFCCVSDKVCLIDSDNGGSFSASKIYALDSVSFDKTANNSVRDKITSFTTNPGSPKKYDDVTFTLPNSVYEKNGYVLIGVYAVYTNGDLNGKTIALTKAAENGSKWLLPSICGNCYLTADYRASSYRIYWNYSGYSQMSGDTNTMANYGVVGIGMPLYDMPNMLSNGNYTYSHWRCTGTRTNGNSYTMAYIPADATSASCTAVSTDDNTVDVTPTSNTDYWDYATSGTKGIDDSTVANQSHPDCTYTIGNNYDNNEHKGSTLVANWSTTGNITSSFKSNAGNAVGVYFKTKNQTSTDIYYTITKAIPIPEEYQSVLDMGGRLIVRVGADMTVGALSGSRAYITANISCISRTSAASTSSDYGQFNASAAAYSDSEALAYPGNGNYGDANNAEYGISSWNSSVSLSQTVNSRQIQVTGANTKYIQVQFQFRIKSNGSYNTGPRELYGYAKAIKIYFTPILNASTSNVSITFCQIPLSNWFSGHTYYSTPSPGYNDFSTFYMDGFNSSNHSSEIKDVSGWGFNYSSTNNTVTRVYSYYTYPLHDGIVAALNAGKKVFVTATASVIVGAKKNSYIDGQSAHEQCQFSVWRGDTKTYDDTYAAQGKGGDVRASQDHNTDSINSGGNYTTNRGEGTTTPVPLKKGDTKVTVGFMWQGWQSGSWTWHEGMVEALSFTTYVYSDEPFTSRTGGYTTNTDSNLTDSEKTWIDEHVTNVPITTHTDNWSNAYDVKGNTWDYRTGILTTNCYNTNIGAGNGGYGVTFRSKSDNCDDYGNVTGTASTINVWYKFKLPESTKSMLAAGYNVRIFFRARFHTLVTGENGKTNACIKGKTIGTWSIWEGIDHNKNFSGNNTMTAIAGKTQTYTLGENQIRANCYQSYTIPAYSTRNYLTVGWEWKCYNKVGAAGYDHTGVVESLGYVVVPENKSTGAAFPTLQEYNFKMTLGTSGGEGGVYTLGGQFNQSGYRIKDIDGIFYGDTGSSADKYTIKFANESINANDANLTINVASGTKSWQDLCPQYSPWSIEGYYYKLFDNDSNKNGWRRFQSGNRFNLYAMWYYENEYPLISQDVFTDGTNSGYEERKTRSYKYSQTNYTVTLTSGVSNSVLLPQKDPAEGTNAKYDGFKDPTLQAWTEAGTVVNDPTSIPDIPEGAVSSLQTLTIDSSVVSSTTYKINGTVYQPNNGSQVYHVGYIGGDYWQRFDGVDTSSFQDAASGVKGLGVGYYASQRGTEYKCYTTYAVAIPSNVQTALQNGKTVSVIGISDFVIGGRAGNGAAHTEGVNKAKFSGWSGVSTTYSGTYESVEMSWPSSGITYSKSEKHAFTKIITLTNSSDIKVTFGWEWSFTNDKIAGVTGITGEPFEHHHFGIVTNLQCLYIIEDAVTDSVSMPTSYTRPTASGGNCYIDNFLFAEGDTYNGNTVNNSLLTQNSTWEYGVYDNNGHGMQGYLDNIDGWGNGFTPSDSTYGMGFVISSKMNSSSTGTIHKKFYTFYILTIPSNLVNPIFNNGLGVAVEVTSTYSVGNKCGGGNLASRGYGTAVMSAWQTNTTSINSLTRSDYNPAYQTASTRAPESGFFNPNGTSGPAENKTTYHCVIATKTTQATPLRQKDNGDYYVAVGWEWDYFDYNDSNSAFFDHVGIVKSISYSLKATAPVNDEAGVPDGSAQTYKKYNVVWAMDNPSATVADPTVDYGTAVNLDSQASNFSFTDSSASYTLNWSSARDADNDSNTGYYKKFYFGNNDHRLFAVAESGDYTLKLSATVTRGSATRGGAKQLTKEASVTDPCTVTIKPIKLKLTMEAGADSEKAYTGGDIEFPITTAVDSAKYPSGASALENKFSDEQSTKRPYYYQNNAAGNAYTTHQYGVTISYKGIAYKSRISDTETDSATDSSIGAIVDGKVKVKNAGTYRIREVDIDFVDNSSYTHGYNTNYEWSTNQGSPKQKYMANSFTGDGVLQMTITPVNGLDIYLLYVEKDFGNLSDPTQAITPSAYNGFNETTNTFDYSTLADGKMSTWYVYFHKLKDADRNSAEQIISYREAGSNTDHLLLSRETAGVSFPQAAGRYNVVPEYGNVSRLNNILNNYNGKVVGTENTGNIKFHWVNEEGTVTSAVWTGDGDLPASGRDNYIIKAKELTLTYGGNKIFTYDGTPKGPNTIITSGMLDTSEQDAFTDEYGDAYDTIFRVYFYGIPLPKDWSSTATQADIDAYVASYSGARQIVSDTPVYLGSQSLSLQETNAGKYGVVIVGAAYLSSTDNQYHPNNSYVMSNYFALTWEVKQVTLEPTATTTSTTFGDVNYGGMKFTFNKIKLSDQIKISSYSIKYKGTELADNSGYIRYSNIRDNMVLTNTAPNNVVEVYGTHVGTYTLTLTGVETLTSTTASGKFGLASEDYGSYGNNYRLDNNKAENSITITNRDIKFSDFEYTTDLTYDEATETYSGTWSTVKPEMIYKFKVYQGVRISISGLYAEDFLTEDITVKGNSDCRKISASDLVDLNRINVATTTQGNPKVDETITGGKDYFYYIATNASDIDYEVHITGITYTDPTKNGADPGTKATFNNYNPTKSPNATFKIKQKVIKLDWRLDGEALTDANRNSIIYNKAEHSVTVANIIRDDDVIDPKDYKVYRGDTAPTLVRSETGFDGTNAGSYTASVNRLTSGNYAIFESDTEHTGTRTQTWSIQRRNFTLSIANAGSINLYTGADVTIGVNLVAINEDGKWPTGAAVDVNETAFSNLINNSSDFIIKDALQEDPSVNKPEFRTAESEFVATNVGKYVLKYDAGLNGIDVGTNWHLTGSGNFLDNDKFLFAIVPVVVEFNLQDQDYTASSTYIATNLDPQFMPQIDTNIVPDGDVTFECEYYNKTKDAATEHIYHAGEYTLTISEINSDSHGYVLASKGLETAWFVQLGSVADMAYWHGYYTDEGMINSYKRDVTVTQKVISIGDDINIRNRTYNGELQGLDMSVIYNTYVKDELFDADKPLYNIKGNATQQKHADKYQFSLLGFENTADGYCDYCFDNQIELEWQILPKTLSFTFTPYHSGGTEDFNADGEIEYDGNSHGYTMAINGVVAGESLNLSFGGNNLNITSPVVLSSGYSVIISGSDANVYNIGSFALANRTVGEDTYFASDYALPEGNASKVWEIVKRIINITWHNLEVTYRADAYIVGVGDAPYAEVSGNFVGGDTLTFEYADNKEGTDAGEYSVTITGLGGASGGNYQLAEGSVTTQTWKIKPKKVSVFTWELDNNSAIDSVVYNGSEHKMIAKPTFGGTKGTSAADDADGKVYSVDSLVEFVYETASGQKAAATVANSYVAEIMGFRRTTNYVVDTTATLTKNWEITKRDIHVYFTYTDAGASCDYDSLSHGVTVKITDYVLADYSGNLSFGYTNTFTTEGTPTSVKVSDVATYTKTFRSVNKGAYSVTVAINPAAPRKDCYNLIRADAGETSLTASFTINALTAQLDWTLDGEDTNTQPYSGAAHAVVATVANRKGSDSPTVELNNGAALNNTNQGSYTATATAISNGNYELPASCTFNYTITPRELTVSWANAGVLTYDGSYKSDRLTVGNLLSETVYISVEFLKKGTGNSYTTVKVVKLAVTDATAMPLDGAAFAAVIDSGTYRATVDTKAYASADGTENDNYILQSVAADNFTVNKKNVSLTGVWTYTNDGTTANYSATDKVTYNAKAYTLQTAIATMLCVRADTGVIDTVALTYTGNVNTNAAEYTATATGLSGTYSANYNLTGTVALDYEILQKSVDLIWDDDSTYVYGETEKTMHATIATGATSATDGKAYEAVTVVEYENDTYRNANEGGAAYVTTAKTLSSDNYVINQTTNDEEWYIARLKVNLLWQETVSYEYDATEKTVTASITNKVSGDTVNLTYSGNKETNVGDYTATVTGLVGTHSNNYTIVGVTNLTQPWEITPVVLEFEWQNDANLSYSKTDKGATLNVSKIASSDENDTAKLDFTINIGTGKSGNTTAKSAHTDNNTAIRVTGILADTYSVSVTAKTGSAEGNYSLPANTTHSFTIAPRTITLDAWRVDGNAAYSVIYSKSAHIATAHPNNICTGDVVTLKYDTLNKDTNVTTANSNSATYAANYTTTLVALEGADKDNYTLTGTNNKSKDWTITPKSLSAAQIIYKVYNASDVEQSTPVTYDATPYHVIATVTDGATADNDGKKYTGDTIIFRYTGEVTVNKGISAITDNTATNAGTYTVTIESDNDNYTIANDASYDLVINQRALTATISEVPAGGYTYSGNVQGITVTIAEIMDADNSNEGLRLNYTFNGTLGAGTRSTANKSYSRVFNGCDADTYNLTATLTGTRASNYTMNAINTSFVINKKDITSKITISAESADHITYKAVPIEASDLSISFTGLILGESLKGGTDFDVSYKNNGGTAISAPTNVGTYKATITLKTTSTKAQNYIFGSKNSTDITFYIDKYTITPSDLIFNLNGTAVDPKSELTYAAGENKTFVISSSDTVFNTIAGKTIGAQYFGFCTCGLRASSASALDAEHLSHQWLADGGALRTTGPIHAGNYCMVLTLSGGDSENFKFEDFDGYGNSLYFDEFADGIYLTWYNNHVDKAIDFALPVLGDNRAAYTFGINRLNAGMSIAPVTDTVPFRGTAYTATAGGGLPTVTDTAIGNTDNIRVTVNSVDYSYAAYTALTNIRNAGTYNIRIYDGDNSDLVADGCDLYSSSATTDYSATVTITKSKITVTDAAAWSKVYDKTRSYTGFSYATDVTYVAGVETDGIISGTTLTITCAFDGDTVGHADRDLIFTLSGADKGNYYLVFRSPKEGVAAPSSADDYNYLVKDTHYTVSADGTVYNIQSAASITPKPITVTGKTVKDYDGNNTISDFNVKSSDIYDGDSVTVTGTYDDENVGTDKPITITSDNPNYTISTTIATTGTINPKKLTVTWTGADSVTPYDGNAHGVTATITGMVSGHTETINVIGTNIADSTITDYSTASSFSAINAKEYSVKLELANGASSNYVFDDDTLDSASWTISKRTLEVTWSHDAIAAPAWTWTDIKHEVEYSKVERSVTATITNKVGSDEVGITLSNDKKTAVGDYTATIGATLTGAAAANYARPTVYQLSWSITRATITNVVFDDVEAFYDANPHGPVVTTANGNRTQYGDTISVTFSGGAAKTNENFDGNNAFIDVKFEDGVAKTRTITATITAGDNYNDKEVTATVLIKQTKITSITMANVSATYDGDSHKVAVNKTKTSHNIELADDITYTIIDKLDPDRTAVTVNSASAINAGTYTVKAVVGANNLNYEYKELTATLTIAKAEIDENRITVVADTGTVVYNKQEHGITVTVTDNVTQYGDAVNIAYSGGYNNTGKATNASATPYEIRVTVSVNPKVVVINGNNVSHSNYNEYTTQGTLTINPKPVTLTKPSVSLTYNGTNRNSDVKFTYVSGTEGEALTDTDGKVYYGDTLNLTYTRTGKSGAAAGKSIILNAGDYDVVVTLGNANYTATLADRTAEITVAKAQISGFYLHDANPKYNGLDNKYYLSVNTADEAKTDEAITEVNLINGDKGDVSYKYNTTALDGAYTTAFDGVANAGTYYIQATIVGQGEDVNNYEVWTATATLTIDKANLTGFVFGKASDSFTYDGAAHSYTLNVPAAQIYDEKYHTALGDEVTVSYTVDGNAGNSVTNVKRNGATVTSYVIEATMEIVAAAASNYNTAGLTTSINVTVNPFDLTSRLHYDGGVYDYNGSAHNAVLTVDSAAAPAYPQLTYSGSTLTVKLSASHTDTFGVTVTNTADNSFIDAIHAGDYSFRASFSIADEKRNNYIAPTTLGAEVTINPVDAYTGSTANIKLEDNIFYHNTATGARNITYCGKEHIIILAEAEEDSVISHDPSAMVTSWTFHPQGVAAVSDEATVTYTYSTSLNGEYNEFVSVKNAGTYYLKAVVSHPDYNEIELTTTLTIEKANISYYFVGTTRTYDTNTYFIKPTEDNAYSEITSAPSTTIDLCENDKASVAYTYSYEDVPKGAFNGARNAGTYKVTATLTLGENADNYNYWNATDNNDAKTAIIVIEKAVSTVIWTGLKNADDSDVVYEYDSTSQKSKITAKFRSADGVTDKALNLAFTATGGKAQAVGDTTFTHAGEYSIIANHADKVNYEFSGTDSATVTMNQYVIRRRLANTTKTYDGNIYYLILNAPDLENPDPVSTTEQTKITVLGTDIVVRYTYTKGSDGKDSYYDGSSVVTLNVGARNAGTYTVQVEFLLDAVSDFSGETHTGTLTIGKKNITITAGANGYEKEYDGNANLPSYTISGIVGDDTGKISFTAAYDNKSVGTGKNIVISCTTSEHYEYLENNYTKPGISNGKITVKTLSITDKSLGTWQKTYDGTTRTTFVTDPAGLVPADMISGIVPGDKVTVTATYNSKNVKEANSLSLTIGGNDRTNYSLDSATLSFADVDFNTVYLIQPLNSSIDWKIDDEKIDILSGEAYHIDYKGTKMALTATVTVYGDDAKGNGGTYSLPLKLNNVAYDPNGSAFRNHNDYTAEVDTALINSHIFANYGITSSSQDFVIDKAELHVNWVGFDLDNSYTYNGNDQGASVNAGVTLKGDDATNPAYSGNVLSFSFYEKVTDPGTGIESEVASSFLHAGSYVLRAEFKASVDELNNNYTLTDSSNNLTMARADIRGLKFSAPSTVEWSYDGNIHFFFVTNDNVLNHACTSISRSGDLSTVSVPKFYYEYDPTTEIAITYSGNGDSSLSGVNGNNGRLKATDGVITITTTVAATRDYKGFSGSINVKVNKVALTESNMTMDSLEYEYDGTNQAIYVYNVKGNPATDRSDVYSTVTLPDGRQATVNYIIHLAEVYNTNFDINDKSFLASFFGDINASDIPDDFVLPRNFAKNAGTYIVNAFVSDPEGNYETLNITGKQMVIKPMESEVVWVYNNQATPNFTYNGVNQANKVTSNFRCVDGEGTDYTGNYITLTNKFELTDPTVINGLDDFDDLKRFFVLAGTYTVTATISEPRGNATAVFNGNLKINNYSLTNNVINNLVMKKFRIAIEWYYTDEANGSPTKYDDNNPEVYDGNVHGVTPKGRDIPADGATEGALIPLHSVEGTIGGTAYTSSQIHATASDAYYTAYVDTLINEEITIRVGGSDYSMPYTVNYELADNTKQWQIRRRPLTIESVEGNFISKIYDGNWSFTPAVDPTLTDAEKYQTEANGTVTKLMRYITTENFDTAVCSKSFFAYKITNIIDADKENIILPISEITADTPNVLASEVTIKFGALEMGTYRDYTFVTQTDSTSQANANLITPRKIWIGFTDNLKHVYNGNTFSYVLDETNTGSGIVNIYTSSSYSNLTTLIAGNVLKGTIVINRKANDGMDNTAAGEYTLSIENPRTEEKVNDTTYANNYSLTLRENVTYTILARYLKVNYTNVLQSLNSNPVDVGIKVKESESDLTDLDGETDNAKIAALNALFTADGFTLTIGNAWQDDHYTSYTRINGSAAEGSKLRVTAGSPANANNYKFDMPTLQITYLQVSNPANYEFTVNNLSDLQHLDSDIIGLLGTAEDLNEEINPIFRQTADISGLVGGQYTKLNAVRKLIGTYDGQNHSVSDLIVVPSPFSGVAATGFFAEICDNATLTNVNFRDIHVYVSSNIDAIGGLAGKLHAGATVSNIAFNGVLYAKLNGSAATAIGGLIGESDSATVNNVSVAIELRVVTNSVTTVYVGGLIGHVTDGAYSAIDVFGDVSVTLTGTTTKSVGAMFGLSEGSELSVGNYRYLAYALYLDCDGTVSLLNYAFGNDTSNSTGNTAFADMLDGAASETSGGVIGVSAMIPYIVRPYHLPGGTMATSVEIKNFRQIALILAYPYLNYTIDSDIYCPMTVTTHKRGIGGTITVGSGKKIYSDMPNDVDLVDVARSTMIVIKRKGA